MGREERYGRGIKEKGKKERERWGEGRMEGGGSYFLLYYLICYNLLAMQLISIYSLQLGYLPYTWSQQIQRF